MKRFRMLTAALLALLMMSTRLPAASMAEEIPTLKVWGSGDAKTEDLALVSEALSAITREKIGAHVELYSCYGSETTNLALPGGEQIDLLSTHNTSGLTTLVATGYLQPLDELLEKYGQPIMGVLSKADLAAGTIDGALYSIPSLKDTARAAGLAMRKDILDELQIDPATITDWDKAHEVLLKVKENYPDIYPIVPTWAGGGMQGQFPQDELGGTYGVLPNASTDSTTVVDLFESEEYKEFVTRMYQWNQEGLIMPDATTTTENNLYAIGFAAFENIKPGKALEISKANNLEVYLIQLSPTVKSTQMLGDSSFAIPESAKYPEKAMELWALMYTDAEISNLFINGLEGKHWEYTDESKTFIRLPEGVSAVGTGYSSLDWAWPNCRITPVWEGGDTDLWAQLQTFVDDAAASPAMGFRFDSTMVMSEVTACNNVTAKYDVALRWGILDPAEALPQFIAELKAAGVGTIVAEKQAQLDAWLKENK